jgi:hypothetical protein
MNTTRSRMAVTLVAAMAAVGGSSWVASGVAGADTGPYDECKQNYVDDDYYNYYDDDSYEPCETTTTSTTSTTTTTTSTTTTSTTVPPSDPPSDPPVTPTVEDRSVERAPVVAAARVAFAG